MSNTLHSITTSRWIFSVFLLMALIGVSSHVKAGELVVGMSTALSGPSQALGNGMKNGVETYFKKANRDGGVNGNTIKLIVRDDGYEPDRCAPAMRQLIDEEKVLAVIGNVGTPTAAVAVPIANEKKTLLFGAYTGAGLLRNTPADRYVINYRASYAEETAAMVTGLLEIGIKPTEIAFFTQNDGYGDSGYKGAIQALKDHGYADAEKLPHGRYTRNTVNVEDALAVIVAANPNAVIMVGAYKPCAAFIKMAKEFLPGAIFANVSFVGSIPLAKELGPAAEGVVVTQVVPSLKADLPIVKEYREELAKSVGQELDFVSLEGYIVARIFVDGLKKAGENPTRESIVDAIEGISSLDLGGITVKYDKTNHQASHQVWPTVFKNGEFVDLKWADLKK